MSLLKSNLFVRYLSLFTSLSTTHAFTIHVSYMSEQRLIPFGNQPIMFFHSTIEIITGTHYFWLKQIGSILSFFFSWLNFARWFLYIIVCCSNEALIILQFYNENSIICIKSNHMTLFFSSLLSFQIIPVWPLLPLPASVCKSSLWKVCQQVIASE